MIANLRLCAIIFWIIAQQAFCSSLSDLQRSSLYRKWSVLTRSSNSSTEVYNVSSLAVILESPLASPSSGTFNALGGSFLESDAAEEQIIIYRVDSQRISTNEIKADDSAFLRSGFVTLDGNGLLYLSVVSVYLHPDFGWVRSPYVQYEYTVYSGPRPDSYAYFVPYWNGKLAKVALEASGASRAQLSEIHEFANYFSEGGVGLYDGQTEVVNLELIDTLRGFEGGFAVKTNLTTYLVLSPYHDFESYSGKVVIVDTSQFKTVYKEVKTTTNLDCQNNYIVESYNASTGKYLFDLRNSSTTPCIHVMDLETINENLVGFRGGFSVTSADGRPYAVLVPSVGSKIAVIDMLDIGLKSVVYVELEQAELTGFSSGFSFLDMGILVPFKTYRGPIGGVKSTLDADKGHYEPYFHGNVVRFNISQAISIGQSRDNKEVLRSEIDSSVLDLTQIDLDLRGFSGGFSFAKFGYLVPLQNTPTNYFGKVVQIDLTKFSYSAVTILDVSRKSNSLKGFNGAFTAGQYVYLVPFRNQYEPKNGMRGSGILSRIDLNDFGLNGITMLDLTATIRSQIPSYPDISLRGFSSGFAVGKYGILVPFFNSIRSGKIARFNLLKMNDVQELNMGQVSNYTDELVGFSDAVLLI